ncbi:unnamed protein product [Blepharisma stoltei]|uniref:Uncharacterized protein n=1 Tax=Blepharisma stoltei TaxID=1481888 RepID=A0AAU9J5U5_9CILI|nr:unnamed protein product [Blepharisma stoltei]
MLTNKTEFRLKILGLWIFVGLCILTSSLTIKYWFYLDEIGFNVIGTNLFQLSDTVSFHEDCMTYLSFSNGFHCLCEKDLCETLGNLYIIGKVQISVIFLAIPSIICQIMNIRRKIWRIEERAQLQPSFFDNDIVHFISPLFILGSLIVWTALACYIGPETGRNLWNSGTFRIGPACKNAIVSGLMLGWGCFYYFHTVRKDYRNEFFG